MLVGVRRKCFVRTEICSRDYEKVKMIQEKIKAS